MISSLNVDRRVPRRTAPYFTEGSRVANYARVLYAAALAALLTGCSQIDYTPAASTAAPAAQVGESADMPTVVVTASRAQPERIG